MSVVTLNVHFDGPADAATLSWVGNDGAEVKYCEVRRGGEVRQETFPGHEWVLRSKGGGDELARFVAAAEPALQEHRVPADAAADAADAAGDARDGGAAARREEDVGGDEEEARAAWAGVDCRFERLSRPDRRGRTMWREIGPDGSEVGRHVQLEASCHTRWVWWLDQAFAQLRSLSNDREAYLFYAMTFASAWQLDSAVHWPAPAREARLAARANLIRQQRCAPIRRARPPSGSGSATTPSSRWRYCCCCSALASRPRSRSPKASSSWSTNGRAERCGSATGTARCETLPGGRGSAWAPASSRPSRATCARRPRSGSTTMSSWPSSRGTLLCASRPPSRVRDDHRHEAGVLWTIRLPRLTCWVCSCAFM